MNTLFIYIDSEDYVLKNKYIEAICHHNNQIPCGFPNTGFDLFNPCAISIDDVSINPTNLDQLKINTQIKCSMVDKNQNPCRFYLYAISSVSKTKIRLVNKVGIIDSNFPGNIICVFDIIKPNIEMEQYARLLQLSSGNLCPFKIILLETNTLGTTFCGSGRFGSTDK